MFHKKHFFGENDGEKVGHFTEKFNEVGHFFSVIFDEKVIFGETQILTENVISGAKN